MYPHNFTLSLTMTLLQFLTCARPQYHHFGQNWLVLPQKLHVYYTEQQIVTWQSLPELTLEDDDFTSEQTEVPNSVLGTPTNDAAPFEDSERATAAFTPGHQIVLRVVSFQDQNASENNNPRPIERQMPVPVDLHGSGL